MVIHTFTFVALRGYVASVPATCVATHGPVDLFPAFGSRCDHGYWLLLTFDTRGSGITDLQLVTARCHYV